MKDHKYPEEIKQQSMDGELCRFLQKNHAGNMGVRNTNSRMDTANIIKIWLSGLTNEHHRLKGDMIGIGIILEKYI